MKFAVVGSGISGLSMALILSQDHEVTLYEIDERFGGHSNTIEVDYSGKKINVDTGFIVFNKLNYPNLIKLFKFLNCSFLCSLFFALANISVALAISSSVTS